MHHSKSGPFENLIKIDHLKSQHVLISDPHCNAQYDYKIFHMEYGPDKCSN